MPVANQRNEGGMRQEDGEDGVVPLQVPMEETGKKSVRKCTKE